MDENERKYGDDVPVMAGDVVRESGCRATMQAVSRTEDGTGVVCRFYEPSHPESVKDDQVSAELGLPVGTRTDVFPVGSLILVRRG